MPFSFKNFFFNSLFPLVRPWRGRALLGAGCSWAQGKVAHGCAWRKCGTPKAMPHWPVSPCLEQGKTHPCAEATGWGVAGQMEDQKMKMGVFYLRGALSFRGNKNGKAVASIINCWHCSHWNVLSSVFSLCGMQILHCRGACKEKIKISSFIFWHFCCMWILWVYKEMLLLVYVHTEIATTSLLLSPPCIRHFEESKRERERASLKLL